MARFYMIKKYLNTLSDTNMIIKLPKTSGYVKFFGETKSKLFQIKDKELLAVYNKIYSGLNDLLNAVYI